MGLYPELREGEIKRALQPDGGHRRETKLHPGEPPKGHGAGTGTSKVCLQSSLIQRARGEIKRNMEVCLGRLNNG